MSDVIRITGLTLHGYHGVFDEEKRDGQRFIIDVALEVSPRDASTPDDITTTINYAEVAEMVSEVVTGEPVDLIETLAYRIAEQLAALRGVISAEVTVHKPDAPVGLVVNDVSFTTRIRQGGGQ